MLKDFITDKAMDDAFDNTVNSIKNKNTLITTFAWTAIAKETYGVG